MIIPCRIWGKPSLGTNILNQAANFTWENSGKVLLGIRFLQFLLVTLTKAPRFLARAFWLRVVSAAGLAAACSTEILLGT